MNVLAAYRNLIKVKKRSHFGPNDEDVAENVINIIDYFNQDITEIRKSAHPNQIEEDEYVISIEPKQELI